jgi:hypothetical protein
VGDLRGKVRDFSAPQPRRRREAPERDEAIAGDVLEEAAEILSRRRSCDRIAETLVRWSRAA